MAWIRRRRQRKTTVRAARLFLALEGLSAGRPRGRRVMRASLGPNR
jgi:hypothetical protein